MNIKILKYNLVNMWNPNVSNREDDEKLMFVETVEEYAFLHKMKVTDVLDLFKRNNIAAILKSEYDVLHMLDIQDSVSMVEKIIERSAT